MTSGSENDKAGKLAIIYQTLLTKGVSTEVAWEIVCAMVRETPTKDLPPNAQRWLKLIALAVMQEFLPLAREQLEREMKGKA